MDVLVTQVYDKCRFKHYLQLKFGVRQIALKAIKRINEGAVLKLTDLPECDVIYLQRSKNNSKICSLKIIKNMTTTRKPTIPPYCDNERESFKQKAEEMYNGSQVYSVTYTELVKRNCTMNKQEIDKLLVNPCVKSINIIME